MASKSASPMELSGMRAMLGSDGVVLWKSASASRCREGDEGAVNLKTIESYLDQPCCALINETLLPDGPVNATLHRPSVIVISCT